MAKLTKKQKDVILENFDSLIKELNNLAKEKGITDIKFEGLIVKSANNSGPKSNCHCGIETFIDPRTGKVSKRCKKC